MNIQSVIAKTASAALIGTAVAGGVGVAPAVGATMAATAQLITFAVAESFSRLPTIEEDGLSEAMPTFLLEASWLATSAQISQIVARTLLSATVGFYPSLVITGASLLGGFLLTENWQESMSSFSF